MITQDLALNDRLSRYLKLTQEEHDALATLQRSHIALKPGEMVTAQGGRSDYLYILKTGWMHSSKTLFNGKRQILNFHYSGDLVGTSSIAWKEAAFTLTTVTSCHIAEVPKNSLGLLFNAFPRIAGSLYAIAAAEAVASNDRLTSIGRMQAMERMATLLLDISARLRTTGGDRGDTFELPLTQADLGDATGMTKIHVNRTLRAMELAGTIERKRSLVRIVDQPALAQAVGFLDRYQEIATDWLPPATPASHKHQTLDPAEKRGRTQ